MAGKPSLADGDENPFEINLSCVAPVQAEDDDDGDSAAAPPVPQPPVDNFIIDNLVNLTDGAMTGKGGYSNALLNGVTGDIYAHLINVDAQFLTNAAEVGNVDLLQMGIVQALDVFGMIPGGYTTSQFGTPVEICFRGSGSVFFISAVDGSIQQLPAVENGDVTLQATETVPGWYRVIYLDGQGWVSAQFVNTSEGCNPAV